MLNAALIITVTMAVGAIITATVIVIVTMMSQIVTIFQSALNQNSVSVHPLSLTTGKVMIRWTSSTETIMDVWILVNSISHTRPVVQAAIQFRLSLTSC